MVDGLFAFLLFLLCSWAFPNFDSKLLWLLVLAANELSFFVFTVPPPPYLAGLFSLAPKLCLWTPLFAISKFTLISLSSSSKLMSVDSFAPPPLFSTDVFGCWCSQLLFFCDCLAKGETCMSSLLVLVEDYFLFYVATTSVLLGSKTDELLLFVMAAMLAKLLKLTY